MIFFIHQKYFNVKGTVISFFLRHHHLRNLLKCHPILTVLNNWGLKILMEKNNREKKILMEPNMSENLILMVQNYPRKKTLMVLNSLVTNCSLMERNRYGVGYLKVKYTGALCWPE